MKLYTIVVLALCGSASIHAQEASGPLTLIQQGLAEYRSGHLTSAEKYFIDTLGTLAQSNEVERAATLTHLGNVYATKQEYSKAASAYSEALSIYRRLSDKNHSALILHNL